MLNRTLLAHDNLVYLGSFRLSFQPGGPSREQQRFLLRHRSVFQQLSKYPSTTNIYIPQWSPACFTEAYNPSNFTLDTNNGVSINRGMTAQLNLQATGAMAKRYHLGSRLATIEIGGKFRNAHKFDNEFVLTWLPKSPTISMTQFANKFTNNNYYGAPTNWGRTRHFQTFLLSCRLIRVNHCVERRGRKFCQL